jgi:hypothetical protein
MLQFKLISQIPWRGARFTLNTYEPTWKIEKASFSFSHAWQVAAYLVCKEKNKMKYLKYLLAVTDQFVDYLIRLFQWQGLYTLNETGQWSQMMHRIWRCTNNLVLYKEPVGITACLQTCSLKWISETDKFYVLRQPIRSDKWNLPDKDLI